MEGDAFTGSCLNPTAAVTGDEIVLVYHSLCANSGGERAFVNTFYLPEAGNGVTVDLAERLQNANENCTPDHSGTSLVSEGESGLVSPNQGMLCAIRQGAIGSSDLRVTSFGAFKAPAIGSQFCQSRFHSGRTIVLPSGTAFFRWTVRPLQVILTELVGTLDVFYGESSVGSRAR